MPTNPDFARRRALQFIARTPLLPLASSPWLVALASCTNDSVTPEPNLTSTSFTGMAAPTLTNAADMATTSVSSSMVAKYSNGTTQNYRLAYEPFFTTGAQVPDGKGGTMIAGGYYNLANQPIVDVSDANRRQFFSDAPDGMSLLTLANPTVSGVKGNAVFAVVQFEYTTRNVAGASHVRHVAVADRSAHTRPGQDHR